MDHYFRHLLSKKIELVIYHFNYQPKFDRFKKISFDEGEDEGDWLWVIEAATRVWRKGGNEKERGSLFPGRVQLYFREPTQKPGPWYTTVQGK